MAFPIFPILLIAGVAMFSGAAGKRSGRGGRKQQATVYVPVGVFDPGGVPVFGGICGPTEEREQGVWSAFTKEGECLVFWDADTDETMAYYVKQVFDESGHSEKDACAPGPGWQGDPFAKDPTLQGEWVPNPIQVEIVKKAIAQAYPQIPGDILPPSVAGEAGHGDVPDYVEVVWAFTLSIFLREICGYIPVT